MFSFGYFLAGAALMFVGLLGFLIIRLTDNEIVAMLVSKDSDITLLRKFGWGCITFTGAILLPLLKLGSHYEYASLLAGAAAMVLGLAVYAAGKMG